MFNKWAILSIFFIALVLILIHLNQEKNYFRRSHDEKYIFTSLIIFKLPRSGSSWFTEIVNKFPQAFISKEIVQQSDFYFSSLEKENHIHSALLTPTGKLSTSHNLLPSHRFFNDYYLHSTRKYLRKVNVCGFSVNPENVIGINWERVLSKVPNPKVIVLRRSNFFKIAVSAIRGKRMKEQCGSANLRVSDSICKSNFSPQLNVSTSTILKEVKKWIIRYSNFDRLLSQTGLLEKVPTHVVYYEDLLRGFDASHNVIYITKIANFLSIEPHVESNHDTRMSHRESANSFLWAKRTPNDLSEVLSNFQVLSSQLIAGFPLCQSLFLQLNDFENSTVFHHSPASKEESLKCIEGLL